VIEKYTQCRAPRPFSAVILDIAKSSPDVSDGLFCSFNRCCWGHRLKLLQKTRPQHHVGGSNHQLVVAKHALHIQHWSAARPHFFSLLLPISASQQYVLYCLWSLIAGTLAGIRLVDTVEVHVQPNFAGSHLGYDGADWSGQFSVQLQGFLVWFPTQVV
jgi:hypothetical protein